MRVIESKVYAATIGAGAGGILSAFLLWLLGVVLWGASSAANQAVTAVAAVPTPVAGLVGLLITLAGTFLAGYAAPHTPRPDLPPVSTLAPPVVADPPPRRDSVPLPSLPDPVPPARGKIR